MQLSRRVQRLAPSPLVALSRTITELRAAGFPVIDLGIGEPDFDTAESIKVSAIQAMNAGATKYTSMPGNAEIRRAIVNKFMRENGLDYSPEQIIVSNGVKQIIFDAMMATLDPGTEVIVPAPYWMSYPNIIELVDGTAVIVPCSVATGFKLTPDALAGALSARTRWLLLNSPNNPSGAVYSREELEALVDVLQEYTHVLVLSDDIYEHIRNDGGSFPTIAQCNSMLPRTLTANGVSKAYAMTGWRLGYAGGPEWLIRAMIEVQAQSTSAPSSISQAAAVAALTGPQDDLLERSRAYQIRRTRLTQLLSGSGLECRQSQGSFYSFVGCSALLGRRTPGGRVLESDWDVSEWLLADSNVALLPGSAFGSEGYLRISVAAPLSSIEEASRRIVAACAELS